MRNYSNMASEWVSTTFPLIQFQLHGINRPKINVTRDILDGIKQMESSFTFQQLKEIQPLIKLFLLPQLQARKRTKLKLLA